MAVTHRVSRLFIIISYSTLHNLIQIAFAMNKATELCMDKNFQKNSQ